jgi:DNA-binding transcriptional LysR family regulator
MIDFEWYRSFMAVYRSGTVTGAAEARFLTQPAISQHIAALESAVGHALFQRTPRKMIPTEYGKTLYGRMAPAMDSLEKVSVRLRDSSIEEVSTIRLGAPMDYIHEVGLEKLKNARFRLQLEFEDTDKMIEKLSRGKLDAVIATQQTQSANIDYTKIDQETFCLVASPDVLLPEKFEKNTSQKGEIEHFLSEQKWVSYSVELPIIRRFWHVAFNKRPNIEPIMVAPSLLVIRKAVELGVGISVLPRYMCHQSLNAGKLHVLWAPKEPLFNDLWVATRKVDRNKNEIGQFLGFLRGVKSDVSG